MKHKSRLRPEFWKGFRGPVAVAHRGGDGAGTEKENSLAAFRAAYKLGYRWFETDVVATKDRKLLAIHGRGYQLKPNKDLPPRSAIRWMKYSDFAQKVKIGGEKVPLLEEILDEFPDIKIFVDPKTFRSVPALIKVLSSRPQDIDRICIGAFSKMRTIKTAYIVRRNTGKEVCTLILGPLNSYPVYLAARLKFLRPLVKYYVEETRAGSLHVPYRWITNSPKAGAKLLDYTHSLGLNVAVYTPNSEKTIRASLEGGVDVVISDRVALLKDIVEAKHKRKLA
jgi:glycerophosphoryl diester phosphodiesterase